MYALLLSISNSLQGPILLHCADKEEATSTASKELSHHRDEAQVQLDVDRSFVYYPEGTVAPVWQVVSIHLTYNQANPKANGMLERASYRK